MNRLLGMPDVRELLALQGRSLRWVQQRLQAIAQERQAQNFALFRLRGRWFTTEEDLRLVLPELFAHQAAEADTLRELVQDLRRRVELLERGRKATP